MADNSVDNKKSTKRLRVALDMATQLHAEQTRKHTTIPYLSHLLGVTSLVLEDGGSEDEAIAALLHDAVEDQGGLTILEEIRTVFGENVANPESYKDANLDPEDHFFNITTRPKTLESVVWDVPEWPNTGLAGPDQATPDIAVIVQAIVDRDDWASGNSMAFILEHSGPSIGVTSSSGGREAEAYDGTAATKLTIIYE